jgi:hypothetical protein
MTQTILAILTLLYLLGLPTAMRCVDRGMRRIPVSSAGGFLVVLLWPLYAHLVIRVALFGFREGE